MAAPHRKSRFRPLSTLWGRGRISRTPLAQLPSFRKGPLLPQHRDLLWWTCAPSTTSFSASEDYPQALKINNNNNNNNNNNKNNNNNNNNKKNNNKGWLKVGTFTWCPMRCRQVVTLKPNQPIDQALETALKWLESKNN